ncbi:hypothetical protein ACFL5O_09865, partial [Myxococcota bacterium]
MAVTIGGGCSGSKASKAPSNTERNATTTARGEAEPGPAPDSGGTASGVDIDVTSNAGTADG